MKIFKHLFCKHDWHVEHDGNYECATSVCSKCGKKTHDWIKVPVTTFLNFIQ